MFRHVVLFRWSPTATDEQKQAVSRGLARLPAAIPELVEYRFGPDHGLADGNWDFVVVADFEDSAAYEVYRDHAHHQDLIVELIRPVVADRAAVQYELAT
jgi:hypothetical protein